MYYNSQVANGAAGRVITHRLCHVGNDTLRAVIQVHRILPIGAPF